MDKASRAAFSVLKSALLKIWIPAVGAQTGDELWSKSVHRLGELYGCLEPKLPMLSMSKGGFNLCRNLVFRRDAESYFDIQPPFQLSEAILAGSWSEGLFLDIMELSDVDMMCVLKNIRFSQEDQEHGSLLLREDTPFVHAFLSNKEEQCMWSEFFHDTDTQAGKHRLSSRKLKEKLQKNYQQTGSMFYDMLREEQFEEVSEAAAATIHKSVKFAGMSLADSLAHFFLKLMNQPIHDFDMTKEFQCLCDHLLYKLVPSSDIVLAISCGGWPSFARKWLTRERVWPDAHTVEKIAQGGFHIVPKSSPDGDFRLSFSCAETKLIETLSPLQHKVLRTFKAAVKYHQSTWSPTIKDIVSSYH